MDKPEFIGERSLRIIQSKPAKRRLVGFVLDPTFQGPLPEDCHLVIRDGEITGRVTSVFKSPTLDRAIGLAYVAPDQTAVGSRFTIRGHGGTMIEATVTKTPFITLQEGALS
jgi:sarcosine oxidase subunit alpha